MALSALAPAGQGTVGAVCPSHGGDDDGNHADEGADEAADGLAERPGHRIRDPRARTLLQTSATAHAEGVDPRTFEKVIWVHSADGGDALVVVDAEDHLDLR